MALNQTDIVVCSTSHADDDSFNFCTKVVKYLRENHELDVNWPGQILHSSQWRAAEYDPHILTDRKTGQPVHGDTKDRDVYILAVPTGHTDLESLVQPDAVPTRIAMAATVAHDYGARRITAVVPSLPNARAEKGPGDLPENAPKEKVAGFSGRSNLQGTIARMWKVNYVDRVLTIHPHSTRIGDTFRKEFGHDDAFHVIDPVPLILEYVNNQSLIKERIGPQGGNLVLVGTDDGSREIVLPLYDAFVAHGMSGVSYLNYKKTRKRPSDPDFVDVYDPSFSSNFVGIDNKIAFLIDDMDDSGGTKFATFNTLWVEGVFFEGRRHKPAELASYSTHPVLGGSAFRAAMNRLTSVDGITELVYTNTHPTVENTMIYDFKIRTSIIRTAHHVAEGITQLNKDKAPEDMYKLPDGRFDLKKVCEVSPKPYRRSEHPLSESNAAQ